MQAPSSGPTATCCTVLADYKKNTTHLFQYIHIYMYCPCRLPKRIQFSVHIYIHVPSVILILLCCMCLQFYVFTELRCRSGMLHSIHNNWVSEREPSNNSTITPHVHCMLTDALPTCTCMPIHMCTY